MRIAFIGWEFPPKISGGLGRHCYFLAKALAERGNQVVFFLPSVNAPASCKIKNLEIVPVNADDVERFNADVSNRRLDNFDIIHGHDWMSIDALLAQNAPKVLTIHSTDVDRSGGTLHKSSKIFEIERKGVKKADAVITVSKKMAQHVKQLCETDREINVVYNGVQQVKPVGASKKNVVLFVGRLTEQKGVEYLLLAFREVLAKLPAAQLWIVGQGQLSPKLKHFASLVGVEKKTTFFGHVSDKKLASLYSSATIVAMPSLREPFGIVALEALAYRRPLVVSKHAGVAELLQNGKSALVVEPTDSAALSKAITALLTKNGLRRKLSENGKVVADSLNWDAAAEQTERVYAALLQKH